MVRNRGATSTARQILRMKSCHASTGCCNVKTLNGKATSNPRRILLAGFRAIGSGAVMLFCALSEQFGQQAAHIGFEVLGVFLWAAVAVAAGLLFIAGFVACHSLAKLCCWSSNCSSLAWQLFWDAGRKTASKPAG